MVVATIVGGGMVGVCVCIYIYDVCNESYITLVHTTPIISRSFLICLLCGGIID